MLLLRFAQDLEEYGKVESMPVLEGKRMTMFIAPKKTTPKKASPVLDDEDDDILEAEEATRKKPQQKAQKEYTGPKVEGEDFDD